MKPQARNDWLACEWLEADGLGGFASGTVGGIRTRRYHALLLAATTPPTGRMVLVNGIEVWLETPAGRFALSSQRYAPDVVYPDGQDRLVEFCAEPWPRWRFRADDGTEVAQELIAHAGSPEVALRWRLLKGTSAGLEVRPLMSGRDYHSLHHENPGFAFEPGVCGDRVTWQVYPGLPPIAALASGAYHHEPTWYRNFLYEAERGRGLDFSEDLASPGAFTFGSIAALRHWCWQPGPARAWWPIRPPMPTSCSSARPRAAHSSLHRCGVPPTPMSFTVATARPSSPAIPGSLTGVATPSSHCAAS